MSRIIYTILIIGILGNNLFAQSTLIGFEYWFNNDYNNAQFSTVPPTIQYQLNAQIDATALPEGLNVLNIRFRDINNIYSATLSKVFVKVPLQVNTGKKLVEYEYWFNNDYNNVQVIAVSQGEQQQFVTNFDASALPEGLNVLNIRFKDENNVYSAPISKVFIKVPLMVNTGKNLVEYEYWFNDDYSNAKVIPVSPAAQQLLVTNLNASSLTEGVNILNFRYRDENKIYSSIVSKEFLKQGENVGLIENTTESSIRLFPNPSSDGNITLDLSKVYNDIELQIIDAKGNVILKERRYRTQIATIKLKAPKGVYYLGIKIDNTFKALKIIIE